MGWLPGFLFRELGGWWPHFKEEKIERVWIRGDI